MRLSASKTLTSAFLFEDTKRKRDDKTLLKDGLRTTSRILYAAGGLHDKHLSIAYSDGKSENTIGGRTVFLDSDVVMQPRAGFTDIDLRNDVLIGSALVGANSKLTADAKFYDTLVEEDENIKRIYQTAEFRASEIRVETKAPGLVPYLDMRADYYTDPDLIGYLNEAVEAEETSADTACALLNNAMLHRGSAEAVDMGVYTEAVNEAVGLLERCEKSQQRHTEATAIVEWFKEMFDPEQPPPPPQGGGGDGDDESEGDDENENPSGGGQGQGDGEGDGEPQDGDGEGQPGNGQPGIAEANAKFDKEMSVMAGVMETETGGTKAVEATQNAKGRGADGKLKPNAPGCQGMEIGEDCPANGWGDEVEPAGLTVKPVSQGSKERYDEIVSETRVQTRALVNKLSWTANEPTIQDYGYRSGDLDEGGLTNLFIGDPRPAVFCKTEVFARPDVAIGIMVDESGSMGGEPIESARKIAVMLTEAFRQIAGTRVRVWGHTTGSGGSDICEVLTYVTAQHSVPHGISTMRARSGNIDGAALRYAAQELVKFDSDAQRRILFCISDGMPSGGQENGVDYNRRKAEEARRSGVEVFGIGIENAYSPEVGERLFGKDAFCILPDTETAGTVIGAFVTRTVNRLR